MTKIERIEHTEPGYDCEYGPCVVPGCAGYGKPGRPGGGHGIHGDEWHWGVLDEGAGLYLSLIVHTDIFPATIPASHWTSRRPPCKSCGHPDHERAVCGHAGAPPPQGPVVVERQAYVALAGAVEGSKQTSLAPIGYGELLVTVVCSRHVSMLHSAKVLTKDGRVVIPCDLGPAHVVVWAWKEAEVLCTRCGARDNPPVGAPRELFRRVHAACPVPPGPACACPARPLAERRRGADLTLHRVSRRRRGETDGDLRGRLGIPKVQTLRGTDLVCLEDVWSTALGADEFFKVFGDPAQRAQAETFWVPLEQRLAKERASLCRFLEEK